MPENGETGGGDDGVEQLDLTATPGETQIESTPFRPKTAPYDPAPEREKIRGSIALILVWLLVGLVAALFLSVWFFGTDLTNIKTILELVLAPIIGLVGAITGFYYGEKSKS